ncbi:Mur ligase family protein [Bacteroidales bacterium]|nr:Mur ligase family protein [Bacteroidales bacterium]
MRIHFIAIGGAAMHNLAIALHKNGYTVSGSDDEVFEPSKSRLNKYGLLPSTMGWNKNNITSNIDAIILGMHARIDNPELLKARELGLKIYSYPGFLYEQTKNKTRIVVAGSHGKTTITSMILHVLKSMDKKFNFMVGAQIDGFETMVNIDKDAEIAVFEGDEYLSSPIDRRSKFMHYKPHAACISGIEWDHINVFKTETDYKATFTDFIESLPQGGYLTYFNAQKVVETIKDAKTDLLELEQYDALNYTIEDEKIVISDNNKNYVLNIVGKHNVQNLVAARNLCKKVGISHDEFYKYIQSFKGSSRRLEKIYDKNGKIVFFDFAHAPSKVKATVASIKEQYPNKKLVALFELHTFSSLNKSFLPHYKGSLDAADISCVYYSPETIVHKKLESIKPHEVKENFDNSNLIVATDKNDVMKYIMQEKENFILLIMTSGNLGGIDIRADIKKIIE